MHSPADSSASRSSPPRPALSDRSQRLLTGLSTEDRLIEIGPSYNPVAAKAAGWNTRVVDHGSRAELVAKYSTAPEAPTERIEDVDVVWRGGPLEAGFAAGDAGSFTALIASHVLEHVPDPIGFFQSAATLLHPMRGSIRLALPDKRLCFDLFRPAATTGRVLAAHRGDGDRHTYADLFDHVAYLTRLAGRAAWAREPLTALVLDHTLEQARGNADAGTAATAGYVDCHAWQFTPASFELLMLELGVLGEIDWRIDWLEPQPAMEFLVSLSRPRHAFAAIEDLQARRLELLRRMLLEMREVTEQLLDAMPATVR
jgi:SAM-dependent methyltransferase